MNYGSPYSCSSHFPWLAPPKIAGGNLDRRIFTATKGDEKNANLIMPQQRRRQTSRKWQSSLLGCLFCFVVFCFVRCAVCISGSVVVVVHFSLIWLFGCLDFGVTVRHSPAVPDHGIETIYVCSYARMPGLILTSNIMNKAAHPLNAEPLE